MSAEAQDIRLTRGGYHRGSVASVRECTILGQVLHQSRPSGQIVGFPRADMGT